MATSDSDAMPHREKHKAKIRRKGNRVKAKRLVRTVLGTPEPESDMPSRGCAHLPVC